MMVSRDNTFNLNAIWNVLTRPNDHLTHPEDRRKALLLSSMLISLLILVFPAVIFTLILVESEDTGTMRGFQVEDWPIYVGVVALFVAYGLSRTRQFKAAAIIATYCFPIALFGIVFTSPTALEEDPTGTYIYIVAGVFLSAILLSLNWTISIAVVNFAGMCLVPLFKSTITYAESIPSITSVSFLMLLAIVISYMRDQDLKRINKQIKTIKESEQLQQQLANDEKQKRQDVENIISDYMAFIDAVSSGDLTLNLAVTDRGSSDLVMLGNNLNDMVNSLLHMATEIDGATTAMVAATTEIQSASTQQATSAEEQAVIVQETSITVNHIRDSVHTLTERAENVAQLTQQSMNITNEGRIIIDNSISSMKQIKDQVDTITQNIFDLSDQTTQIREIIDMVNSLAEQSKMLALNANIEAARAGEHGRGFAIVATEVRQLADESRNATKRVEEILNAIQNSTRLTVQAAEEGSHGVNIGMQLIEKTGNVIDELSTMIEEATVVFHEIAGQTTQQLTETGQLVNAMEQIRVASEQSANAAKETNNNVYLLMETAETLENAVLNYQI